MLEFAAKRETDSFKSQAAIHGIKFDEDKDVLQKSKDRMPKDKMMFAHPDAYKKLSKEERDNLTKKMMGKYKAWAGQTELSTSRQRTFIPPT